ncbi:MAG TPA: ORF6N domain-containing protein [Gemmataceae bacterium]|nr:ORF6N domain-containing protein [Gemmataceae bacterium]
MAQEGKIVLVDEIEPLILDIRGQKVLLDSDLANLYAVSTGALNQAVKRNRDRFPDDFLFQLTAAEKQEVVTNCDHLHRLKFSTRLPYAFTEHGTMMAAMLLNSPRAVEVSVFVVRAFVKLRRLALAHKELAAKLDQLEKKVVGHDDAIRQLVSAIRQLMTPPAAAPRSGRIGFRSPESKKREM